MNASFIRKRQEGTEQSGMMSAQRSSKVFSSTVGDVQPNLHAKPHCRTRRYSVRAALRMLRDKRPRLGGNWALFIERVLRQQNVAQ